MAPRAAREPDRDLDATTDADSLRPRLYGSSGSAAVAAADATSGYDGASGNTSWDLYRGHAFRVALVQAAESTMLS